MDLSKKPETIEELMMQLEYAKTLKPSEILKIQIANSNCPKEIEVRETLLEEFLRKGL